MKQQAIEWNNQGVQFFLKQEWGRAEEMYMKASQADPENSTVWNNLGLLAHQNKDYSLACANFRKASELEKKPNYLVNEGNALTMQSKFGEAEQKYKDALTLQKDYEPAIHSLARLFVHLEQYQNAIDHYRQLAESFGKGTYLYELALLHTRLGDYSAALEILYSLARVQQDAEVWFQIGRAEFLSKNYGLAEKSLKSALADNPDHKEYRHYLAMNYLAMGENDKGVYHLNMLIKLFPEDPDLLTDKGVVLCGLNDFRGATDLFQKALQIQPGHTKALHYQQLLSSNH